MPRETAEPYLPARRSMRAALEAVHACRGCPLFADAKQAVFGEGLVRSQIMMVGEQPGDQEDRQGRPFVGPSGRLLRTMLDDAGIPEDDVYITNAVKHFKFTMRGKRRLHQRPLWSEVTACRPWLLREIDIVQPAVLVALGSTAAQSLFGRDFRVTHHRGERIETDLAPLGMATVHPSSLLRAADEAARRESRDAFRRDLDAVKRAYERIRS